MKKISLVFGIFLFLIVTLIAQPNWSSVGPFGGEIRSVWQSGSDLLVGTGAGIYKTSDGGLTYKEHSRGIPSGDITSLFASGNTYFACIRDKGIYTSTDGGVTWALSRKGSYLRQDGFGRSDFQQVGNSVFIRGYTTDSLYFTQDGGQTWTARKINNSLFNDTYAAGNSLFAYSFNTLGAQAGLYRSDDLGQTWNFSAGGMPANTFVAGVLDINDTLFALNKHVWRSVDGGANWLQMTTDTVKTPTYNNTFSPQWTVFDGTYIWGQNGGNIDLLVARWKPGDSGWKKADTNLSSGGNTHLMYYHSGKVFLSRFEGLYSTSPAFLLWAEQGLEGINGLLVNDIYLENTLALATHSFLFSTPNEAGKFLTTSDLGSQWTVKNPANISNDLRFFSVIKMGGNYIMGVENIFGVLDTYLSTDQGNTWATSLDRIFDISPNASFLTKGDSLIIYGSYGGTPAAFITNNLGQKISDFSTGLFGWSFDDYLPSMIVHKGDLYCVITSATNSFSKIRKWDLPSATFWATVAEKIDDQFFGATAIASWQNKLYLGMIGGGVKVSNDDGASWTDVNGGLSGEVVRYFLPAGDSLLAATNNGVWLLESGNNTWESLSGNLPVSDIRKVQVSPWYVWALTENGGVWRLPRFAGVDIEELSSLEVNFYPNPAEDILTVELPLSSPSSLTLLDIHGKRIHQWTFSETKITLNLPPLNAGVYLLKIEQGGGSTVKKVVMGGNNR
ncbi:MAG: T9SS type A sorting domain-containing protein [Bacteroidia bacterium]|nr:T9SS type A sorting domain-containing protein [Bacteroidia bacterium]